jgi:hypothetical protein
VLLGYADRAIHHALQAIGAQPSRFRAWARIGRPHELIGFHIERPQIAPPLAPFYDERPAALEINLEYIACTEPNSGLKVPHLAQRSGRIYD